MICNFVKRLMMDCDGWLCRRSTPRDDRAKWAHNMPGSTDGWRCSVKWVWLDSLLFSYIWIAWLSSMQICTPHAIAVDMYIWIIWFEWDVKMFDGIVRQMKKNRFWKVFKFVYTKQDDCMRIMNIDCVALLKGW